MELYSQPVKYIQYCSLIRDKSLFSIKIYSELIRNKYWKNFFFQAKDGRSFILTDYFCISVNFDPN